MAKTYHTAHAYRCFFVAFACIYMHLLRFALVSLFKSYFIARNK